MHCHSAEHDELLLSSLSAKPPVLRANFTVTVAHTLDFNPVYNMPLGPMPIPQCHQHTQIVFPSLTQRYIMLLAGKIHFGGPCGYIWVHLTRHPHPSQLPTVSSACRAACYAVWKPSACSLQPARLAGCTCRVGELHCNCTVCRPMGCVLICSMHVVTPTVRTVALCATHLPCLHTVGHTPCGSDQHCCCLCRCFVLPQVHDQHHTAQQPWSPGLSSSGHHKGQGERRA
jgi:hypothetical protein